MGHDLLRVRGYKYENRSGPNVDLLNIAKWAQMSSVNVKDFHNRMSKSKQILSLDHKYGSHLWSGENSNEISSVYLNQPLLSYYSVNDVLQIKVDVTVALLWNLGPRELQFTWA